MTNKKRVFLDLLIENLASYGFVRYKDGAGRLKGTVYQYIYLENVFNGGIAEVLIEMVPLAMIESADPSYSNMLSSYIFDNLAYKIDTSYDDGILKNMQRSIRCLKEKILPIYDNVDSAASLLAAYEQLANIGVESAVERIRHERSLGVGKKVAVEAEIEEKTKSLPDFLQRHKSLFNRYCLLEMGKYEEACALWNERAKEFEQYAHKLVDSMISRDYHRLSFKNKRMGIKSEIEDFSDLWDSYFEMRNVIWHLENKDYDWIRNVYLNEKTAAALNVLKKAKII